MGTSCPGLILAGVRQETSQVTEHPLRKRSALKRVQVPPSASASAGQSVQSNVRQGVRGAEPWAHIEAQGLMGGRVSSDAVEQGDEAGLGRLVGGILRRTRGSGYLCLQVSARSSLPPVQRSSAGSLQQHMCADEIDPTAWDQPFDTGQCRMAHATLKSLRPREPRLWQSSILWGTPPLTRVALEFSSPHVPFLPSGQQSPLAGDAPID